METLFFVIKMVATGIGYVILMCLALLVMYLVYLYLAIALTEFFVVRKYVLKYSGEVSSLYFLRQTLKFRRVINQVGNKTKFYPKKGPAYLITMDFTGYVPKTHVVYKDREKYNEITK